MINNYTPEENPIQIKCKAHTEYDLDSLIVFQGGLKTLSTDNKDKLMSSILIHGFIAPVFVWINKDKINLLDGTQRTSVLHYMRDQGWKIPKIPVAIIEADSEAEAREKLLAISSQYGDFDINTLSEWVADLSEEDDMFRFVSDRGEIYYDENEAFYADSLEGSQEIDSNIEYTDVIKAPIYEPKGDKPPVRDLVNYNKTKELLLEIEKADIKEKALEDFLIASAQRHSVFSYDKIAEFYSHSNAKIQDLMERSALVIIDFNKAIENGFVKLSKDIAMTCEEDSENES